MTPRPSPPWATGPVVRVRASLGSRWSRTHTGPLDGTGTAQRESLSSSEAHMTRRRTRTPSRNGPLTNDAPSTAADISPAASGGRAAASRRFASSTPGGGTRRTPPPPLCPRQLIHVLFFYSDAARSLAFLTCVSPKSQRLLARPLITTACSFLAPQNHPSELPTNRMDAPAPEMGEKRSTELQPFGPRNMKARVHATAEAFSPIARPQLFTRVRRLRAN